MVKMKSGSLDQWRSYFSSANFDIFDIIDHAIMVAASDCPKEFKARRDGIAERLFSSRLTRCLGCDRVELAVASDAEEEEDGEGGCKSGLERDGVSKESKVHSSRDDQGDVDVNRVSNYSFGEAEALTDEIEQESQYVAEVLRIRDILHNREEESDSVIFESLRKLQLMELTVDCLKVTEIGKAVNPLRKHGSKDVRQLARTLIDGWKEMVDEWVKATTNIAVAGSDGGTPDSVNPSVVDDEEEEEEGLPSPPLDDMAFFVAPTGAMELSELDDVKFFEGMDDDGNLRQSGQQLNTNREKFRKPASESQIIEKRRFQPSNETTNSAKDESQQTKKHEAAVKLNKPVTADSGSVRLPKSNVQRRNIVEPKMPQRMENNTITRKPPISPQDKSKGSDDETRKLEATKRKLQERYQQAENAKRQRTIQVMELNDLPKQGFAHRNPYFKPGNHNRHWANSRR